MSFSGVGTNSYVGLIPQWAAQGYNAAGTRDSGGLDHRITLGSSGVERVVGGSGNDSISTGAGANMLKGGAGGKDYLWNGGVFPGEGDRVGLPASDEVYRGFAAGPGTDTVVDWGGGADVLDLRPWESSDVYVDTYSYNGSGNSLIVSNGDRGVLVLGHFAPVVGDQENGTMEKIVFADETITSASAVRALVEDSPEDAELRAVAAEAPKPGAGIPPGPPTR